MNSGVSQKGKEERGSGGGVPRPDEIKQQAVHNPNDDVNDSGVEG